MFSLAIYGIVVAALPDGAGTDIYGYGSQAPLWYFGVIGVQALTLTFPFSQAMTVTRREFFTGTMLVALSSALILAIVFLVGGLIERATDGWGYRGYFFYLPWIWNQGPAAAALLYFMVASLAFIIGFWAATIFKRWGLTWLLVVAIGLAALLVLAAVIITQTESWGSVGRALAGAQPLYVALIGLGVSAVLAGISYLTLRRAVP